MAKRMTIMLLVVSLLFGAVFGFQIFKSVMMRTWIFGNGVPAVAVSTIKVEQQPWEQTIQATGSMRSVQGVEVTTEFAGLIREIQFTPGSEVAQGDLLVILNDDSEQAQVKALIASVELAKQTSARNIELYKTKAVSKQTIDTDVANLNNTLAQLEVQKAVLAKKTILAPFSGSLGISYVNPGQYLNPGDKIVTLQALNPILVDFSMPQQFLHTLKIGQKVDLQVNTYPDRHFEGVISTINPKIDTETRNVRVEARIDNPDKALLPGMFAQITVTTGRPKLFVTAPQTAITYNPYGETVFIIETKGKNEQGEEQRIATMVFVNAGQTRGDQVTILKGLKEGDELVVSGQMNLRNGSKVTINNSVMPNNDPDPKPIDQ